LFDVFGPRVSEQVKAVNQRAADLSMGDMARVMGQAGCIAKESWEPEVVTVGQTIGLAALDDFMIDNNLQVFSTQSNKIGSAAYKTVVPDISHIQDYEVNRCGMFLNGLSKRYPPVHIVPVMKPTLIAGFTKGTKQVQDTMEQAWSNMSHLLDMGVDGRTMTVTIKYNDPKTEVLRSLALDADVGLNLSAGSEDFVHFHESMVVKSGRTRETRKHGPVRASQHAVAKK
jgi:hypothetical protein